MEVGHIACTRHMQWDRTLAALVAEDMSVWADGCTCHIHQGHLEVPLGEARRDRGLARQSSAFVEEVVAVASESLPGRRAVVEEGGRPRCQMCGERQAETMGYAWSRRPAPRVYVFCMDPTARPAGLGRRQYAREGGGGKSLGRSCRTGR